MQQGLEANVMENDYPAMNCLISNSDGGFPADKWYQIAPIGEFWGINEVAGGGKVSNKLVKQHLDQEALLAIVANFETAKTSAGANFAGLRIDRDHLSENDDQTTEAMGWIKNLEARADGLYAQIDWSDEGEKAIAGRRYKFVSPTWFFSVIKNSIPVPAQITNYKTFDLVRPIRLDYLALTNRPNLKGMKPLSNRGGDGIADGNHGDQQKGQSMDYKAMLLKVLGQPPEATDEQIQTACDAQTGTADNTKKEIETLKNRVAEFEKTELDAKVSKALDDHKGKIKNKDDVKAQLEKDFDGTLKILNGIAAVEQPRSRILNREDGKAPASSDADVIRNRDRDAFVEEVRIKNGCRTRSAAWDIAARQKPELFA